MTIKLRPSAEIDVVVKDVSGNTLTSAKTHNTLTFNVIQDFGRGLFAPRFSIRMGSGSQPTSFYDTKLASELALLNDTPWPQATAETTWPTATINEDIIEWVTLQKFNIPVGAYVGTLRELGFNFYGDQSNVIHARAVLPADLIIDESYVLEIVYRLALRTSYTETSYSFNVNKDGGSSTHAVTQRWAKRSTLWKILGEVPAANNCRVFDGTLNAIDVDPDGFISESTETTAEYINATSISLKASFSTDKGNSVDGIRSVTWETIPVKFEFSPPIAKSIATDLNLQIAWELSI